jgi:hypothetical protein
VGKARIQAMQGVSYFTKGHTRTPGLETVPTLRAEAVVFEYLFTTGLRMPPHSVLMDILQKIQVQLHQVTSNVVV